MSFEKAYKHIQKSVIKTKKQILIKEKKERLKLKIVKAKVQRLEPKPQVQILGRLRR